MKLKVEYHYPRKGVSKIVDVGNVKNMRLNQRQEKIVNNTIHELAPKLVEAMGETKPKVKLTFVDDAPAQ